MTVDRKDLESGNTCWSCFASDGYKSLKTHSGGTARGPFVWRILALLGAAGILVVLANSFSTRYECTLIVPKGSAADEQAPNFAIEHTADNSFHYVCDYDNLPFPYSTAQYNVIFGPGAYDPEAPPELIRKQREVNFKIFLYHPDNDVYISASFFGQNGRSAFENEQGAVFISRLTPPEGTDPNIKVTDPLIMDIGANIGVHTLKFASLGYRTHAFEAFPENWNLLQCSMAINKYDPRRVVLNTVGLANSTREECMHTGGNNRGGAYMGGNNLHPDAYCNYKVKFVTLDEYWENSLRKEQAYMMKIDIEGSEGFVLQGAHKMFSQAPPMYVFAEFLPHYIKAYGLDPIKILQTWWSFGYEMYRVLDGRPITPGDFEALTDEFLNPPNPLDMFLVHGDTYKKFLAGQIKF